MNDLHSLLRGSLFDNWAGESDAVILRALVALSMTADRHKCRACGLDGCEVHRRLWRLRFAFYYVARAELRRIFTADHFAYAMLTTDPVIHAIDAHLRGLNDGGVFRVLLTYADDLHDRDLAGIAAAALESARVVGLGDL